jgi:hypothetical protein
MRAYVITTGLVFVLMTLVHVWRVAVEGIQLAKDPHFILFTLIAVGLSVWSWRVLRQYPRS